MATSTEVNATLIKYDASGNQTVIYPKTNATNVTITSNSNYSTTNLQTLITALGSLAFRSYTIVTSVDNAASGTLVDGSVISTMNETLTSLKTEVSEMSSVGSGGFDTYYCYPSTTLTFSDSNISDINIVPVTYVANSGSVNTYGLSSTGTYTTFKCEYTINMEDVFLSISGISALSLFSISAAIPSSSTFTGLGYYTYDVIGKGQTFDSTSYSISDIVVSITDANIIIYSTITVTGIEGFTYYSTTEDGFELSFTLRGTLTMVVPDMFIYGSGL